MDSDAHSLTRNSMVVTTYIRLHGTVVRSLQNQLHAVAQKTATRHNRLAPAGLEGTHFNIFGPCQQGVLISPQQGARKFQASD